MSSTLHNADTVTFFSGKCLDLWDKWNQGPAGGRLRKRQNIIKRDMKELMGRIKIYQMEPVFVNDPNVGGEFSWGDWGINIGATELAKHNIRCKKFVDLCATLYHELRHAEQFTRIAQGVRLKRLEIPGVKKIPFFGKSRVISKAMGMSYSATQYALNQRKDYTVFSATPRMIHCSYGSSTGWQNWCPTVDDWLQCTYSSSQSTFSAIGQSDDVTNLPNVGGQYSSGGGTMNVLGGRRDAIERQWYYGAPDEIDAVAIEKLLFGSLSNRFANYRARQNWRRTDPRWGG